MKMKSGTAKAIFLMALLLGTAGVHAGQHEAAGADEMAAKAESSAFPPLIAEIEQLMTDLNALRSTKTPEGGTAELILRVELADRRHRFRTRLVKLGEELAQAAEQETEPADVRAWFAGLLSKDAQILADEVSGQNAVVVDLIDALGGDDTNQRLSQTRLIVDLAESDRLYTDFEKNIEMRGALGKNVDDDKAILAEQLTQRGRMQGGVLRTIRIALEIARSRTAEQDPATADNSQIARLNELEGSFASSTRVTIALLERLGLPTVELREALITLTGSLTEEDLNVEVVVRLLQKWSDDVVEWFRSEVPGLLVKIFFFLLIIFVARLFARVAERLTRTALDRSPVRTSSLLRDFFINSAGRMVMVLGFLIAVAQLGIQIGPLLAGLGIAGFVIGFALQDVLSNFASGMMILVYRPFDVGDFVEAGGVTGKVSDMTLVSTKILTFDNQLLFVPNNKIWGDVIRNVTHQDIRRVDLVFSIGYGDDIEKAERVLKSIIDDHELVLDDPEPNIRLHELADSSVNFVVRPWVKTGDYWDVYWDITREVKRRFDAEGVSIPFPQRDVHLYRAEAPEKTPSTAAADRGSEHSKITQVTEERTLDDSDDD